MCNLFVTHYACSHKKRVLIGHPCPVAQFSHVDDDPVPISCAVGFPIQEINSSCNHHRTNFLLTCHEQQGLDYRQLRIIEICEPRAEEAYLRWGEATRRIARSQRVLTGKVPHLQDTDCSGMAWRGESLGAYPDIETMAAAAWNATLHAHQSLKLARSYCAKRIVAGFHDIKPWNEGVAVCVAADCRSRIEDWLGQGGPQLRQVVAVLESVIKIQRGAESNMATDVETATANSDNDEVENAAEEMIRDFSAMLKI
ncbi:hypothetical protein BU26DRAFT_499649 [Trematosphaeria pertusa]|uniref:Uncharacterized protein n=1 Tax=Trematosphaeria pertusa TaxID=390896 RepID=A0A6A6J4E7_9PLEO|nr:uncharacterized protein BU26DRAFT_499649 [Trematosphaeria pertusa]KAF2257092.1 hypothetical protein BU26DRAFT_499649 [Trematosphaeria pertusa]